MERPLPEPENVYPCAICIHFVWKNGCVTCDLCEEKHIHPKCLPNACEKWHCEQCVSVLTFLASLEERVDKAVASLKEGMGKAAAHLKEGVKKAASALYKAAQESSKVTAKMVEMGLVEAENEHTDVALLNVMKVLKDLQLEKMDSYYNFLQRQMKEKKDRKRKRAVAGL